MLCFLAEAVRNVECFTSFYYILLLNMLSNMGCMKAFIKVLNVVWGKVELFSSSGCMTTTSKCHLLASSVFSACNNWPGSFFDQWSQNSTDEATERRKKGAWIW